MRNRIIKLVTFLGGIYFFLEFVLPKFLLDKLQVSNYHEAISDGFILVGTMAFGLGLINLFLAHGSRIAFVRKGWFNSLALLLGLLLTMSVAIMDWRLQQEVQRKTATLSKVADFARHIKSGTEAALPGLPELDTRLPLLVDSYIKAEQAALQDLKAINSSLLEQAQNDPAAQTTLIQQQRDLEIILADLALSRASLEKQQPNWSPELSNSLTDFASKVGSLAVIYGQALRFQAESSLITKLWEFLFNGLFVALGSAMFSLLGVYIASAAYRAFRVKTFESALMMITAVVVMLGQIPFGVWIYEDLPAIRLWLMEYPSSAAFRAIKIGASVAGLVMAMRMWFSIESDFSKKAAS